ncbi:MAG TPA: ABC transporter permease [Candidatus Corynebacterium avicola]|uniref:ABC transporter permease n=1 Tax=Candidatus Corynebacterium avicola TaxID=2838527 RepID=A0A9D1RSV1_9CORY|nr:ABC transporter permease [Candidatus Corynebacterium avicola]
MYLAFRDIRASVGRFVLIGSVVGLVTLLIVMLTGLTAGLGKQNTSALEELSPDRFIATTSEDGEFSFTSSSVGHGAVAQWEDTDGVDSVTPLGISQTRLTLGDGESSTTESVAVFGLPAGTTVDGMSVPEDGVVLPEGMSPTSSNDGTTSVDLGGVPTQVSAGESTVHHSHVPVAFTDLDSWRQVAHTDDPTVLMVDGTLSDEQWAAAATQSGTTALTVEESFNGLGAYNSERGSLLAIQGLLYGISALVVLAFLSVWTMQRSRDIAVLRALGASRGYVLRDALGQAVTVVASGVAVGVLLGLGLGVLAQEVLPFNLSPATVIVPGAGVLILGVVGALAATRRVLSTDPRTALGANA